MTSKFEIAVHDIIGALDCHENAAFVGGILYRLLEHAKYSQDEIRQAAVYMISKANSTPQP